MTDEELLFQKGWYKEPAKDGKEWRHEEGGFGRYDMQSALKIQKWREVGEAKQHDTRSV